MRDDTGKRPYQVMVRMDRETRDRLQAEADVRGRSLSETGFLLIRERLGMDESEVADITKKVAELMTGFLLLKEKMDALTAGQATKPGWVPEPMVYKPPPRTD